MAKSVHSITSVKGWLLAGILLLSASLNFWNIDFPLGYHADERKKVRFVMTSTQDFKHPILMLQLVRMANLAFGFDADQQIVVLGRSIVAMCATATVFLSYALAMRMVGTVGAPIVAAGVAVAPTLVIHAHYLKEDTLLTLGLMASLLALLKFIELATWRSAVWLGLAAGLAFSSHYKAILLVPLFLIAPLLGALHGPTRSSPSSDVHRRPSANIFYQYLIVSGIVAASVFFLMNWPLVHDLQRFIDGVQFEFKHAREGHDVRIGWSDYWLGFHLLYSLVPGMGWPALAVSLGGLFWILASWKQAAFQDRFLVVYVLLFYLVPEISPLKPAPDFARYIIPIVPVLIYFAWRAVSWSAETVVDSRRAGLAAASLAAIVLVTLPLYDTLPLISSMRHETRARAAAWLQHNGGRALFERYGGVRDADFSMATIDLAEARERGVDYLVASSFMYERYFLGSQFQGQDAEVYLVHQRYIELFKHPYLEIRPVYTSFGFANPVIRIVDIRQESGMDGRSSVVECEPTSIGRRC